MLNEKELNAVKALIHHLNMYDTHDLAFDVSIIAPDGDVLARIERVDVADYQLMFGPA